MRSLKDFGGRKEYEGDRNEKRNVFGRKVCRSQYRISRKNLDCSKIFKQKQTHRAWFVFKAELGKTAESRGM